MPRPQLISAVLALAIAAVLSSSNLLAGIEPEPFHSGPFGVTDAQAVRISIFNDRVLKVCPTPDTIAGSMLIRDLRGTVLFEARTAPIPDGRGAFVDFVPASAVPPTGALPGLTDLLRRRYQVRAEVVITSVGPDGSPLPEDLPDAEDDVPPAEREACRNAVALSLEVFDRLSRSTAFTLPFARVAFNPQPEPPDPTRTPGQ